MAELLTLTLAANEQKQFRKAGSYFEIIDSTYSVTLNLYSDLGSQTNTISGALSGFFLNAKFGAFDVKNSGVAQTVQILVLDPGETGGSRRQPGNVVIVDRVGAAVQTVGAGNSAITAFTATTLLLPSANLTGAIVRGLSAEVLSGVGGNSDCMILAAPSAPTSAGGANLLTMARVVDSANTRNVYNSWDMRKQLPAGWGVYHCSANAAVVAVANACRITFEIL